jgi:hypothetical protein
MARGWESKSVESQMEDGLREGRSSAQQMEELELRRKRESLELSRRNVEHDLERARNDTHRSALQHALSFIDGELKKLDR